MEPFTEFKLLEKSFPFILFEFISFSYIIRININRLFYYKYWYDKPNKEWLIQNYSVYSFFKNFLNDFIDGLIQNKLY